MSDVTEMYRRDMVNQINGSVESDSEQTERARLEAVHGKVWDTSELQQEFSPQGFAAPFIIVQKKDTGEIGSLMFQHSPRFYFDWSPR